MWTGKNYYFHYCHDSSTAPDCAFKLLHLNSGFINGTEITNNPLNKAKWWFLRTLSGGSTINLHNTVRWTAITVLFISHRQSSCDNVILFRWLSLGAYSEWIDLKALHDIFYVSNIASNTSTHDVNTRNSYI